jgi:hypothetical protein
LSETIVRCPKCGEELRVTLTLVPKQPPHTRSTEAQKQIHVEAVVEPKAELNIESVDWKPWKKGTGEWVNVLEAMDLFEEIQKAGGQLEHGGYRYWIFGRNKDMISRKNL